MNNDPDSHWHDNDYNSKLIFAAVKEKNLSSIYPFHLRFKPFPSTNRLKLPFSWESESSLPCDHETPSWIFNHSEELMSDEKQMVMQLR